VSSFLPYGRQLIEDDDVAAVAAALRSDFLTTGPAIEAFEQKLCEAVGAKYAVAVSNGTAALHAACFAAGLAHGDEALVPAITFLATANAVRYCNAEPRFVDVDQDSGLASAAHFEARLTLRTRALLPVHLTGRPVDLAPLRALAKTRNLLVIEDAAHALGARYRGQPIGACEFSDMAIFSFHPVKHITTAEGGAITTNDATFAKKMRSFRSHGMVRDAEDLLHEKDGPWYYEQQELGFNYRLTDVQAVLGTSQLGKLARFIDRRRAIAARYDALFAGARYVRPIDKGTPDAESAYHLYPVLIDFAALGVTRAEVVAQLHARGIGTQVHYIPVPQQPYYAARGHHVADFPGAQKYYAHTLSLPMYPAMSDDDVERVAAAVLEVTGRSAG
jgi:UDP-4-amino-4,6-dideoxy-N-acetyl-beta-L-altrosamine transaminase